MYYNYENKIINLIIQSINMKNNITEWKNYLNIKLAQDAHPFEVIILEVTDGKVEYYIASTYEAYESISGMISI
jgi:hypothetical protein